MLLCLQNLLGNDRVHVRLGGKSPELFLLVGGEPEVARSPADAVGLHFDADDAHVRGADADSATVALLGSHLTERSLCLPFEAHRRCGQNNAAESFRISFEAQEILLSERASFTQ